MRLAVRRFACFRILCGLLILGLMTQASRAAPEKEYSDWLTALAEAAACCASFAEFDFEKLDFERMERIEIPPGSPLFEFEVGGKSFFRAFQLPEEASRHDPEGERDAPQTSRS